MGLDVLVQTDYMSSEHSDAGDISAVDYTKHQYFCGCHILHNLSWLCMWQTSL